MASKEQLVKAANNLISGNPDAFRTGFDTLLPFMEQLAGKTSAMSATTFHATLSAPKSEPSFGCERS